MLAWYKGAHLSQRQITTQRIQHKSTINISHMALYKKSLVWSKKRVGKLLS